MYNSKNQPVMKEVKKLVKRAGAKKDSEAPDSLTDEADSFRYTDKHK